MVKLADLISDRMLEKEDSSRKEMDINKLADLISNKILERDNNEKQEIDIVKLADLISDKMLESVNNKFDDLSKSIFELKSEVEDIKNKENSTSVSIDSEIQSNITNKIIETLDNNFLTIFKTLDQNKYNTKEIVEEIYNKVDLVNVDSERIIQLHKKTNSNILESIENIKKELKSFEEEGKKKNLLNDIIKIFK